MLSARSNKGYLVYEIQYTAAEWSIAQEKPVVRQLELVLLALNQESINRHRPANSGPAQQELM